MLPILPNLYRRCEKKCTSLSLLGDYLLGLKIEALLVVYSAVYIQIRGIGRKDKQFLISQSPRDAEEYYHKQATLSRLDFLCRNLKPLLEILPREKFLVAHLIENSVLRSTEKYSNNKNSSRSQPSCVII